MWLLFGAVIACSKKTDDRMPRLSIFIPEIPASALFMPYSDTYPGASAFSIRKDDRVDPV